MSSVIYLGIEDLLLLVRRLGVGPVRDVGLLASAASRPSTTLFGQDAYPGVPLKAAALMHSLARNGALVDGNKRLAWLATAVFLHLNGVPVDIAQDAAYDVILAVARGELELQEIVVRLGLSSP